MAPKHLVQYGYRPDAGSGLKQRHDLGVQDCGQGIGPATPAKGLLLRWQSPVLFDAIASGGAEPGARSRLGRPLLESVLHVEPHLMVVDVSAGHAASLRYMEELFIPDLPDHRKAPRRRATWTHCGTNVLLGRHARQGDRQFIPPSLDPHGCVARSVAATI